jgi:hypothetical protein
MVHFFYRMRDQDDPPSCDCDTAIALQTESRIVMNRHQRRALERNTTKSERPLSDSLLNSIFETNMRHEHGDAYVDAYPRKCSLCDATINNVHESHNPQPVKPNDEDRCCAKCNAEKVIPARFASFFSTLQVDQKNILKIASYTTHK